MKTLLVCFAAVFGPVCVFAAAPNTAFTYQGHLTTSGQSAQGLHDLSFALYDAPTNGTLLGEQTIEAVPVTNGLFTVALDFGSAPFDGTTRWLEIAVARTGSDGPVVLLSPRQSITAVPQALWATRSGRAVVAEQLLSVGDVYGARLNIGMSNTVAAVYATIAGGTSNGITSGSQSSVIGGGGQNSIGQQSPYATIAGGGANAVGAESSGATISGGVSNRIDSESLWSTISGGIGHLIYGWGGSSTIGGGASNLIGGDSAGMTIAGGIQNWASGENLWATIGGGRSNSIQRGASSSTIAGGFGNQINDQCGTSAIGGGVFNHIEGDGGSQSTIAGGSRNRINTVGGTAATIGGGTGNAVEASFGTIPGGLSNTVGGVHGFAAGRRANARHAGAFVWADHSDSDFASTTNGEFSVRATGGPRFVSGLDTNGAPNAGVNLAPGAGSWSSLSDRDSKENFAAADTKTILEKLAAIPVATWNYKAQDKSVRHIGPIAQDFRAAFGLGEDEKRISTVDADGVALAAIQALHALVKQKDAEIQQLKQAVAELTTRLDAR